MDRNIASKAYWEANKRIFLYIRNYLDDKKNEALYAFWHSEETVDKNGKRGAKNVKHIPYFGFKARAKAEEYKKLCAGAVSEDAISNKVGAEYANVVKYGKELGINNPPMDGHALVARAIGEYRECGETVLNKMPKDIEAYFKDRIDGVERVSKEIETLSEDFPRPNHTTHHFLEETWIT